MSQKIYKDFISLFKRWPIDATKKGRDLGEHIRVRFMNAFAKGELSENVDVAYWTQAHKDLSRIVNNEFAEKYPRSKATGALGIGREHCRVVLSNSAQQYMKN